MAGGRLFAWGLLFLMTISPVSTVGLLLRCQQDAAQGADELRAGLLEFPEVPCGERAEELVAERRHAEQDAAMIRGIGTAAEKALFDGAVDEFDGAVVLQ